MRTSEKREEREHYENHEDRNANKRHSKGSSSHHATDYHTDDFCPADRPGSDSSGDRSNIQVQLQQLHAIEEKVLDYMANVSGLMQNLYQVKRTTELVTIEIPRNIRAATSACKGHLKGTAIALAVSDEVKSVYTEIGSLSALCTSLVKTKTVDGNKVNLLNAAERYWLCEKIVSSLEDINNALYILSWQIQYLSWEDLWRGLDPDTWCNYMQGKWIAESIINDWDDLLR